MATKALKKGAILVLTAVHVLAVLVSAVGFAYHVVSNFDMYDHDLNLRSLPIWFVILCSLYDLSAGRSSHLFRLGDWFEDEEVSVKT